MASSLHPLSLAAPAAAAFSSLQTSNQHALHTAAQSHQQHINRQVEEQQMNKEGERDDAEMNDNEDDKENAQPQQQQQMCPSNVGVSVSDQSCGSVIGECGEALVEDHATLVQRTEAILGVDWELQKEILRDMHKNEKKYRVYNGEAKYLKHRRIIVDWMSEVGEEYKLSPLTIHCSVRYLDRLLGTVDVPKNKLQLVAMACILVASKYEEAEDVIPTLAELNECSNNAYTIDAVKDMEVCVLRSLNWSLTIINPIHFLHFYEARGIVFANDLFEGGPQNRRSALKYVRKYADFFAELCLQEYTFQQYLPSVMAAAVVAAARRAVKIDPIWNPELEGLTTYNERQIFKAYKHLYNYYLESFPTAPHAFPSPKSVLDFEERAQQMPPALPVPVPALAHAPTQSQSAAF